jgi:Cytochrome P460
VRRLLVLGTSLTALAACGGGSGEGSEGTSPGTTTEPAAVEETSTAETTTAQTTTEEAPPPPQAPPGIPGFVAGYRDWVKLNDAPIPPRAADPHNGTKNVYASRERRPSGRFPAGTIVVKDASRPGADFIGLIAIMRKVEGADPAHGDWVFVEYTRESRTERFREQASGAVCWSCHVGADADYVFTD